MKTDEKANMVTPAELLALAREWAPLLGGESHPVASALRSYAELLSAIEFSAEKHCGEEARRTEGGHATMAEAILATAREDGWPGLGEL